MAFDTYQSSIHVDSNYQACLCVWKVCVLKHTISGIFMCMFYLFMFPFRYIYCGGCENYLRVWQIWGKLNILSSNANLCWYCSHLTCGNWQTNASFSVCSCSCVLSVFPVTVRMLDTWAFCFSVDYTLVNPPYRTIIKKT